MPFGTIKLHPTKWDVWARADVVELREAVALSLNIDPCALYTAWQQTRESFDFLAPNEKVLVWERIKLSESHLGGKLQAVGEILLGSKALETKVRLVSFAEFAAWIGWDLPPRFPGRKERDEVGALILNTTRLRPEWNFYADIPHPLLWALVAMACDIDPRNIDVLNPAERTAPDLVQFWKRFTIAQAQVEAGKLAVVEIGEKLPGDFNFATSVSWEVFSRWTTTLSCPWELPKGFPSPESTDTLRPKEGAVENRASEANDKSPSPQQKRKLNNLLVIVAALAKEAEYPIDENPAAAAAAIAKRIEEKFPGVRGVGEDAIVGYLREIPSLIANRRKMG